MPVSLRVVMSLMMTLVAVITAVIGFTPMYLTGLASVQDTMQGLRSNLVQRTEAHIVSFMERPFLAMETIERLTKRGLLDLSSPDAWKTTLLACDLVRKYNGTLGMASILIQPSTQMLCDPNYNARGMAISISSPTYPTPGLSYMNYDEATDNYTRGAWVVRSPPGFSFALRFLYPDITKFMANKTFVPVGPGLLGLQIAMGGPLYNPAGAVIGAFRSEIRPENLLVFLQNLGLRQRARALILDRSNGIVTGISWTNEGVTRTDWVNGTFGWQPILRTKTLSNFTDPLVRRLYTTLGAATIVNATAPYQTDLGSGSDRVYVDMVDVELPGLTLRLVMAMPEIDYLEDVYKKRTATIAGICSAVVVVILMAVVFSHFLTKPLNRLGDRMYATASFQDEEEDDSPSILSEVRDMQEAYVNMKGELNRAKTYLPHSVFKRDDDEGDTDDESASGSDSMMHRRSMMGKSTVSDPKASGSASVISTNSKSSHHSWKQRQAALALGTTPASALNTAAGAMVKNVTVMVINLVGTHPITAAMGLRFTEEHGKAVAAVSAMVRTQRGMLDTFHGDRFVVTFNAVTNTVGHQKRAVLAAFAVKQALENFAHFNSVSVGIASGQAFVGNMGSKEMMRFCTVGPVFSQAVELERLCRNGGYKNGDDALWALCTLTVSKEAELEVHIQNVDVVQLAGVRQIVASIESVKSLAANEEWMYQLHGNGTMDPFSGINDTMSALLHDDTSAAAQHFAKIDIKQQHLAGYCTAKKILLAANVRFDGDALGA